MKGKTISLEQHNKVKKALYEEIKQKEKQVKELKKENILLLKTALKQSAQSQKWARLAKILEKKNK